MKSMDDYIKGVHEKYMETQKNNIVYEKVSMKYPKYSPLTKICGVAACLALICVGVIGFNNFNKMKVKEDIHYATSENTQGNETVYTNVLISDDKNDSSNYLNKLITNSELIAIASEVQIENITHTVEHGRFLLNSMYSVNIDKVLFGEEKINNQKIYFSKIGGKISLSELQKDNTVDWSEWEKMYIGHEIVDSEKEMTYFNQVSSKYCELNHGKTYLMFMSNGLNDDIYKVFNLSYGIMEYDPITNMVKNIDTGEFEEFDWDLITDKK